IAYNNHDIDDGLKSGYITIEQLNGIDLWREVWEKIDAAHPGLDRERKKFQTISALIGLLIRDLITATEANLRSYGIMTLEDVRGVNRPLVAFSSAMEER